MNLRLQLLDKTGQPERREKMKKKRERIGWRKYHGLQIAIIIICVMLLMTLASVSASEWSQFQKDDVNTGVVSEKIIGRSVNWSVMTHTNQWMAAGINVVPIVAENVLNKGDVVFVLDCTGNISGYNVTTGDPIWVEDDGTTTKFIFCNDDQGSFEISTPTYHNGILYVATSKGNLSVRQGKVTAIDVNGNNGNGSIRENVSLQSSGYQLNTPVTYADGKIYIGNWKGASSSTTDYGTYYCLNASNVSDIIWSRTATYVTGYNWAGAAIAGNYTLW